MVSLAHLQERFFEALRDEAPAAFADAIRANRVPAPERFATYGRSVETHWREALAGTYPVVARLVGPGFFGEAARRYARAHPSTSGDLHEYGDRFGEFLAAYEPAADLAYLPDVARLEWAWHLAYSAADAAPLDFEALGRVPADAQGSIRFELHPSVHLLRSDHPIASIWEANQEGRDGTMERDPGPEWVLVQRDALEVAVHRLREAEWGFLAAMKGGASLEQASECLGAEAGQLLAPLLKRLAAAGVFSGFTA
jgi:hypothetical protein